MSFKSNAPGLVTTSAGAHVENAGLDDGSNAFKAHDNKRTLKRQRCEICQWCGLLLEVKGWIIHWYTEETLRAMFVPLCAACYLRWQGRVELNRRRRQG